MYAQFTKKIKLGIPCRLGVGKQNLPAKEVYESIIYIIFIWIHFSTHF